MSEHLICTCRMHIDDRLTREPIYIGPDPDPECPTHGWPNPGSDFGAGHFSPSIESLPPMSEDLPNEWPFA